MLAKGVPILTVLDAALAFVSKIQGIVEALTPLVNGVDNLVKGETKDFAAKVEKSLFLALPVLADIIGKIVGINVPQVFGSAIASVKMPIKKIIDGAIDAILKNVKDLFGSGAVGKQKDFSYKNAMHEVWFEDDGKGHLRLRIASDEPQAAVEGIDITKVQTAYAAFRNAVEQASKAGAGAPTKTKKTDKKGPDPVKDAFTAFQKASEEVLKKFNNDMVPNASVTILNATCQRR